jgi:DNA invertase Pin-like site-specific DNA recombinase
MDIIFEEKVSGAAKDREQLQKMLKDIREGDIIYVKDLIPITCSTRNLFELIDLTQSKKANLRSLKAPWLNL